MSKLEIYRETTVNRMTAEVKKNDGPWRWRYKARNGNVLADSGQGYSRRIDCLKGAASVLGGHEVRTHDGGDHDNWQTWVTRTLWDGSDEFASEREAIPVVDLTKQGGAK